MSYLEEHINELLTRKGVSKAQFAKDMEIQPQNVNKFLKTNNVENLKKISQYLDIPLNILAYGESVDKEIIGCVFVGGVEHIIKSKEDIENLLEIV